MGNIIIKKKSAYNKDYHHYLTNTNIIYGNMFTSIFKDRKTKWELSSNTAALISKMLISNKVM